MINIIPKPNRMPYQTQLIRDTSDESDFTGSPTPDDDEDDISTSPIAE